MGVSNWGGFVAYTYYLGREIRTDTKNMVSGKKGLSNWGGNINPVLTLHHILN